MAVLKIFTNLVDLTIEGGSYSTDETYFDSTRVGGAFEINAGESALVNHEESSGDTTWYHCIYAKDISSNGFWIGDAIVAEESGDNGGRDIGGMRINGSHIQFFAAGDTTEYTTTLTVSADVLYSVDFSVTVTAALITVSGYVNSVLVGTVTAANTTGSRSNPERVQIANPTSTTNFTSYFSEFVTADEDTRGWRLRELRPQSFGVDQAWTGTVNDIIDEDIATGISTSLTGARTSFGLDRIEDISSGDIVNRVVAQTYAQRGATGLTQLNHYFRYTDDSREDATSFTVTTTGEWYINEFLTNPDTGLVWEPEDFAGLQIGLRAQT